MTLFSRNLYFIIPYLNKKTKSQHTYKKGAKHQCCYYYNVQMKMLTFFITCPPQSILHPFKSIGTTFCTFKIHIPSSAKTKWKPMRSCGCWGVILRSSRPCESYQITHFNPIWGFSISAGPARLHYPQTSCEMSIMHLQACGGGDSVMDVSTACVNTALRSQPQTQQNNLISSFWDEYRQSMLATDGDVSTFLS